MEKPNKEKYGWHNQDSFDDLPSGWMLEGGEEAYFEALKEWQFMQDEFVWHIYKKRKIMKRFLLYTTTILAIVLVPLTVEGLINLFIFAGANFISPSDILGIIGFSTIFWGIMWTITIILIDKKYK